VNRNQSAVLVSIINQTYSGRSPRSNVGQHILQVVKLNIFKKSFLIVTSNKETPEKGENPLEFLLNTDKEISSPSSVYMFK